MRKILVIRYNGQLNRAIKQIYGNEDITTFVKANKPDVIMNCSAATNVDGCEKNWDFAYRLNAIDPRNLDIA